MWDVKLQILQHLYLQLLRFTLTMWDVKDIFAGNLVNFNIPFYLNYVGCKVEIPGMGIKYVNSFTLTMWDVKFFSLLLIIMGAMFYLNYVGCKARFVEGVGVVFDGFTLTMWDVKEVKIISRIKSIVVLP